ncbi:sialate O-acetylesterase [soil metagenome]
MKSTQQSVVLFLLLANSTSQWLQAAEPLKVHGVFRSNMVLQRDKPIAIWGWAAAGTEVTVTLGEQTATGKAAGEKGRWEVVFKEQPANARGQSLSIKTGDQMIKMDNILIGDIWVMNGQSNMAIALRTIHEGQFEASMAHLPLLRHFRIQAGAESENVETDISDQYINAPNSPDKNWSVCTPEVALQMGAIGYIFGSRIQRSLQIPIGIIDNGRGGASMESLVPRHQFAKHPDAAEYLAWVDQRRAAFREKDFLMAELDKWKTAHDQWEKQKATDLAKGVTTTRKEPKKPDGSIRTWSVPGRTPSDAASCYNGMFGVFKGLNIKGVAFHQGFNNAMNNTSCNPKFYRTLMKLMVEGWREDFSDPKLPVAVIELCAGGTAQTHLNFETEGFSTAAYIREAQRLGLNDLNDPLHTAFIPCYDQKIPQLHPQKKKELGIRTAHWALNSVYGKTEIPWTTAKLVSAVPEGSQMLLTFDKPVFPDDMSSVIEGFSIADKSGEYYMAHAAVKAIKDNAMKNRQILVSSPLVREPVAVRYAWARSPLGNLKVEGKPWQPLHSFRTDSWDFTAEVKHSDPDGPKKNAEIIKEMTAKAKANLTKRLESEVVIPKDHK